MESTKKKTWLHIATIAIASSILCGVLTACKADQGTHAEWQRRQDRHFAERITKFNYEGHSYLFYQSSRHGVGITHDGNCRCRHCDTQPADTTITMRND